MGTNYPPVFHGAEVVLIGSPSFLEPQKASKMVESTGQLAQQTVVAQTHKKQRF